MWLFEFTEEEDKIIVMAGRPWTFDHQILILNEFVGACPSPSDGFQSITNLDIGA